MRRWMLSLLSASSLAAPAFAGTPPWTISEASPGVMISHSGLTKAALRGGRAEPGDIISTAANARAVLVRGEEYAVVAPNSRLQVADSAASNGLTQFIEKVGNVVFSIRKMATPHFGVQTPYLAAVVKGTTFSVTVDDSGASVQVVEGAVEVATNDGGARELLRPGGIASVGASDLGALTIRGSTNKVLRSPDVRQPTHVGGGAVTATVKAEDAGIASTPMIASVREDAVPAAAIGGSGSSGGTSSVVEISSVQEKPTSLASLSDGLVADGNTTTQAVIASASTSGSDREAIAAIADGDKNSGADGKPSAGNGSSDGKGGSKGNGAGKGNGNGGPGGGPGNNGNGNGPGNGGPGGGPGNNGNGNGPGNGRPGGGPGNNGNGPGNGGPGGGPGNNGNGNGPGNGGPGGGPGNNGNGNGPGNGGPGGGPGNNGNGNGPGSGGPGGGPGNNGNGNGPGNGGPGGGPGNNGNGNGPGNGGPGGGPGNNGNGNGPGNGGPGGNGHGGGNGKR